MLITPILVLSLVLPRRVSDSRRPVTHINTFDCHATHGNILGDSLLDDAIIKNHVAAFVVNSWGLSCSLVRSRDIPVILTYLVPRLEANRQRITVTADTLTLEPWALADADVPIDLPESKRVRAPRPVTRQVGHPMKRKKP